MADANRRIKLFRLIKPSHTAFRAARGKRTKSCRGKQVGHTKKEDKPPPAASGFPRGLLNADLIRISEFLSFYIDGSYIACYGFRIRCRGPPFSDIWLSKCLEKEEQRNADQNSEKWHRI